MADTEFSGHLWRGSRSLVLKKISYRDMWIEAELGVVYLEKREFHERKTQESERKFRT